MDKINYFMEYYFWYLFLAGAIVFPWYVVSKTFESLPSRQREAMGKAIEKGHVLTATLVRQYYNTGGTDKDQTRATLCIYKYQYKGKTYKYQIYNNYPPQTLTLYYIRNPRKAGSVGDIVLKERRWLLRFAVVAGIIIFISKT